MESSRRDLLKAASLTLAAGMVEAAPQSNAASMAGVPFQRTEKVRVGLIGVGGRGNALIDNFAPIDGVEITALCDVVADKVAKAQAKIAKLSKQSKPPAGYSNGDHAFEELTKRDDIDVVLVATPWLWHVPMALSAMKHGKHVGVEVPAAKSIADCWDLVNTSEATRRHCIQLENCCYGYDEMLVWNMVKAGMLGELTHGACAYNHDLRSLLFSDEGEGLWRRFEHFNRNGNLYPTHGLGPVAHYMDIQRGDRFDYMVSMSSPAAGLYAWRKEHLKAGDPKLKETYKCGDLNVSLIHTAKGRVIQLEHNTSSPQPYDRINLIAGTKGIFRDYPPRVYLDGAKREEFRGIEEYKKNFEHKYWTEVGEKARELAGHGGMDFVMAYRLVQCMQQGLPPDIDVYDAATWSAPGPLSEESVAKGSAPVKFPDFTRGRWEKA